MFNRMASIVGACRDLLRSRGLPGALLALAILANAAPGEPPTKDAQGDPLPEGATARLGTTRWRHDAVVAYAAFLPDGKQVVCVTDHGVICVWEFPSGKEVRRFTASAKANKLNLAALSADGKTLASNFYFLEEVDPLTLPGGRGGRGGPTLTSEKEIHLHDLATGKELTSLKVEDGTLKDLTFSPKGEQLTTRHEDVVRTWDWANGKELAKFTSPLALPSAPVTSGPFGGGGPGFGGFRGSPVTTKGLLAYSPDGKSLAFYGLSQVPRFVEASTGKEISAGPGHTEPIVSVWFTPSGKQLFTNSQHTATNKPPGSVHTWDGTTFKDLGPVQPSSTSGNRMIVSPDGRVALDWPELRSQLRGGPGGGGAPGAVEAKLIDLANGKELAKLEFTDAVGLPVFSPDSKTVAVPSADETKIDLYDATKAKLLRTIDIPRDEDDVNPGGPGRTLTSSLISTIQFSPDGKALAFQKSLDATNITVFDVATAKDIAALPLAQEPIPEPPPGGPFRGRVWRTTPLRGDFSPDGRCFALVNGEQVALYEISTGRCRQTYGKKSESSAVVPTAVAAVAVSPSGKVLAYGGKDGIVHLWNVITGKELAAFKEHTTAVTAVAFAPNGKTLASASADTTALLWDIDKLNPRGEPAKAPTRDDLEQSWKILAGADAAKAGTAIADLSAVPKEAVEWIKEQVKPAAPLDKKLIEKWLGQLDDSEFEVREKASAELAQIGERMLPMLDKALAANPTQESRQRLKELRSKIVAPVQGERLRVLRAVEVLERIGTPEAKELLSAVSDWAPDGPLATQARGSLDRLKRLEK